MTVAAPLRVGFIGDGGISRSVRTSLAAIADPGLEVSGILTRREATDVALFDNLNGLLSSRPGIVVECASHQAVSAYGETVLRSGVSLIVLSIGALADTDLHRRLQDAARAGHAKLILLPGAIGGIDALAAARFGGLERVCYRGRKPPLAWQGTSAEQLLDLSAVHEPTVFYRGGAREAARDYPKNSNVAATVALAGVGFERTEVELVADPTVARNVHELSFDGRDGHFEMTLMGVPSAENPKTSMLTAHSVVRILTAMSGPVFI
jgi:aspartate dehydrogenase